MRVIIAGSRSFKDWERLKKEVDLFIKNMSDVEIVSGGARGTDSYGEYYAASNDLRLHKFLPDWGNFGKRAGLVRNRLMAQFADACICFWDGKSRGTANMIKEANENNLELRIIRVE